MPARNGEGPWSLRVAQTGVVLAGHVRVARHLLERAVGLLGRRAMAEGEGLVLSSCRSIHTWGMQFPIDVVFVDRGWQVVAVYEALPPWRMTRWVTRASATIELPAGAVQRASLRVGDRLTLDPNGSRTHN